ncbi:MAG: twin-arginine translocation signal domain-containing protein [SAR202 cluster bacterium]|nr:twin-arginine translocation signal domain-containing protein [SAR202 cluster bacterium]
MKLTRRQFLGLVGGGGAAAVIFQACGVPEAELFVESTNQIPEDLVSGLDNWYATLCRQCPSTEGIVVRVMEGRAKKVEGNVDFPVNQGKHSARCEAGLQALYHPDRIAGPLVRTGERGGGQWEEVSWPDALGRLAQQLRGLRDPAALVMVTSPENSYSGLVADRFVTRFGGQRLRYETLESTNVRRAVKLVYGQDRMPDFDIENSAYILSFGADFLNTWGSPVRHARGYGQFRQGDRERGTHVHVDSRFSMTGASADEIFFVKPGREGLLALSIASVIIEDGMGNTAAADALTDGGRIDMGRFAPDRVADAVGVSADRIHSLAHEFAEHRPGIAIGGGSAAAHTNGLFNMIAIYSLNHLVNAVGVPGGVMFNPQPPIRDLPAVSTVSSFADWQKLAGQMRNGGVGVLMVRDADPMYGLPGATGFRDASFNVPVIVSFSNRMDDTTALADIVLPEHSYLEDWDIAVPDHGPGYQTVGFQQPVIRPFFESRGAHLGTRSFADAIMTLAADLGLDLGLPATFAEMLQDGAAQLHGEGRGSVTATDFRAFWNGALQRGGWWDANARSAEAAVRPPALPAQEEAPQFDGSGTFHLIPFASASLMDGRGASLPWLQATPDPISSATWRTWVEINAKVAEEMDIREGDLVRIVSSFGNPDASSAEGIEALAYPHPGVPPDVVCVPLGQGHRGGTRYEKGRGSNIMSILAPRADTQTGALAWAATRVSIQKTGGWVRLPKFENTVPDFPRDEEQEVIKITPTDT